jgi:hypothetical protein
MQGNVTAQVWAESFPSIRASEQRGGSLDGQRGPRQLVHLFYCANGLHYKVCPSGLSSRRPPQDSIWWADEVESTALRLQPAVLTVTEHCCRRCFSLRYSLH